MVINMGFKVYYDFIDCTHFHIVRFQIKNNKQNDLARGMSEGNAKFGADGRIT